MAQSINLELPEAAELTLSDSKNELNPDDFSPIVLAYIGDAVYEVIIRRFVMAHGNVSANKMHKITSSFVSASSQSEIVKKLQDVLTDEEKAVYKRGRNAKSGSVAKNQTMSDYRHATGFEALIGYLYLKNKTDRIYELLNDFIRGEFL